MAGAKRVTEGQLAADRRNALRSAWPRTSEGKAAARYNALTHGILARAVIPEALDPHESREDFDALLATLRAEFAPANSIEEPLVEQIAVAYWRLSRLYRAESGAIAQHRIDARRQRQSFALLASTDFLAPQQQDDLDRQLDALDHALTTAPRLRAFMVAHDPGLEGLSVDELRARCEALRDEARAAVQERDRREAAHRAAVDDALDSLPPLDDAIKFARYETALQRQLDRAMAHLERLQRHRRGEYVPPPIDITIDAEGGASPPP